MAVSPTCYDTKPNEMMLRTHLERAVIQNDEAQSFGRAGDVFVVPFGANGDLGANVIRMQATCAFMLTCPTRTEITPGCLGQNRDRPFTCSLQSEESSDGSGPAQCLTDACLPSPRYARPDTVTRHSREPQAPSVRRKHRAASPTLESQ
jgi:hypothetical protein